MLRLNDTQRIMLSAAAQRDDHSLHSLPEMIKAGNRNKAIADLIDHGFAKEHETTNPAQIHRTEGDLCYGVFATSAGIAELDGVESPLQPSEGKAAATEPRTTKSSLVLTLLHRDEGATLVELVAATDWLPHTTRAALTGLRKKGHAVERSKRGDDTCYRIVEVA